VGLAYLVGGLVVSSVWGLALGVVTAALSAAVIGLSYVLPSEAFVVSDSQGAATLTIMLAVAVVIRPVTPPARSQLIGADERRGEGEHR
jgi:K+-sensing histidine kinase KdpD